MRIVPKGPVRVALVGLGWAARSIWLPRLGADPAYAVVAVVDPDPAGRAAALDAVPDAVAVADAAELTADTVDLAVVAVPNHLHAATACGLLERGVAVFLEKPVCLTADQARDLAAAEARGGAVLLAGSAARYRADVRALHAAVAELGPVRHVTASWVRASGVPDAGGWFTDRRRSGGGALVDLGWHLLDAVTPVLGPVTFDHAVGSVSADFVTDGARAADWRGTAAPAARGDVEDTARGFLLTDGGVSVALRASWASHEATDMTTVTVDAAGGTAVLRCTFGFSPNRVDRPVLTCTRDGETVELPVPAEPIGAEYDHQLAELPSLLADPGAHGRAAADAARTVGVIERIYRSARPTHAAQAIPA